MTPNVTTRSTASPAVPDTEPTADLHPDVQSVIAATDRLPVHDERDDRDERADSLSFETPRGTASVSVPEGTTEREAAAIAVAVAARLREEREAAAEPTDRLDRWAVSSRLGRRAALVRDTVERGERWTVAGRIDARGP